MKTFRLLQPEKICYYGFGVMLMTIVIMLLSPLVFAEDQPKEKDENQMGEQIQIVADKLITHNEEKYAEFIGDVQARQGDFTINSEHLRIYYKDNLDSLKNQTGSQELIKRIVASGNVKISSDQYIAESELVEYDLESTVLVLKGENSTIKNGNNVITGSKITVYRKDEKIMVERSTEKRVKAVFYSKEKNSKDQQKTE